MFFCLHWIDETQNGTFSPRSPEPKGFQSLFWARSYLLIHRKPCLRVYTCSDSNGQASFFSRVEAHCCFLFRYLLDGYVSWRALGYLFRLPINQRGHKTTSNDVFGLQYQFVPRAALEVDLLQLQPMRVRRLQSLICCPPCKKHLVISLSGQHSVELHIYCICIYI